MEFQVFLTPKAEQDLELIGQYLARADVEVAYRFCGELFQQAESLHLLPGRGHPVHGKPGIRKLIYGNYLIIYKIHEVAHTVEILRFWHSARNQGRLRLREDSAPVYAIGLSGV